jgi:hypothetical protein
MHFLCKLARVHGVLRTRYPYFPSPAVRHLTGRIQFCKVRRMLVWSSVLLQRPGSRVSRLVGNAIVRLAIVRLEDAPADGRGVQSGLRMRAIRPWRAGGPWISEEYCNVLKCLPGLPAQRREPQVRLLPGATDALLSSGPLLPDRDVALQDQTFEGASVAMRAPRARRPRAVDSGLRSSGASKRHILVVANIHRQIAHRHARK